MTFYSFSRACYSCICVLRFRSTFTSLHGSTHPNKKDHLLRSRDFVASTTVASRTLGSLHASTPSTISSVSISFSVSCSLVNRYPFHPLSPTHPQTSDCYGFSERCSLLDAHESWARLLRRKLTIDIRSETRIACSCCVTWVTANPRAGVYTASRRLYGKLKLVRLCWGINFLCPTGYITIKRIVISYFII